MHDMLHASRDHHNCSKICIVMDFKSTYNALDRTSLVMRPSRKARIRLLHHGAQCIANNFIMQYYYSLSLS